MRRLSLLPPTTTDRLEKEVNDWSEVLYGLIPLEYLEDSYIRAYRDHKPGYTMEAAEIIQAWYRLRAETPSFKVHNQFCVLCVSHKGDNSLPPCPFHQSRLCTRCRVDLLIPESEFKGGFTKTICPECCRLTLSIIHLSNEMIEDTILPIDFSAPFPDDLLRCKETYSFTSTGNHLTIYRCRLVKGHSGEHEFIMNNNLNKQKEGEK